MFRLATSRSQTYCGTMSFRDTAPHTHHSYRGTMSNSFILTVAPCPTHSYLPWCHAQLIHTYRDVEPHINTINRGTTSHTYYIVAPRHILTIVFLYIYNNNIHQIHKTLCCMFNIHNIPVHVICI